MNAFRILKTKMGWSLFRNGSVKPLAECPTKDGILEMMPPLIGGKAASIKVQNENGTFSELRF